MIPVDGASTLDLRRHNRRRVLNFVRTREPLSRGAIAEGIGLTEPAVSRITRELIDAGLLKEVAKAATTGRPGRPLIELELGDDGAYVLGLEIGAIDRWISLTNIRGDVIARAELNLLSFDDPGQSLKHVAAQAESLVDRSGIEHSRLVGGGVAIAGLVDNRGALLVESPNLGWRHVAVASILEDRLGIPCKVESRPNALILAESRLGIARGRTNITLVLVGLGIGGALMFEGRLVRGQNNAAGQIGHLQMPGTQALCTCGRYGCLDTVASGYAILTRLGLRPARTKAQRHDVEDAHVLRTTASRADDGDASAVQAFRSAGEQLGHALKSIVAVADPEAIILAGPVPRMGGYLEGVRATFPCGQEISLVASTTTIDSAAAWLALEAFVFSHNLDIAHLKRAKALCPAG